MTHKLTPGKPARVVAGEYNAAMEAGQWFTQQRQLGGGMSGFSLGINPCVCLVKNESGGDLASGAVVELGASLLTTLDKSHLWLSASTRSGNGVCGVLLDPVPYNSMGLCQISGLCLANVDIVDADNTHGRVVPSSTQLTGDFGGYVRIVQKPSGTGVKLCVVELGNHQSIVRKARSTSTITASGSGTANIYINGSSVGSVTVYNDWRTSIGDIASGEDIDIMYMHDQDKWVPVVSPVSAAKHPVWFYDSNVIVTSGSSYPRGGSYATSEWDTVGYQETYGSRSDNNVTPMSVASAEDPFVEIGTTGLYRLFFNCRVTAGFTGTEDYTYTTGAASAGTSHTHPVATYAGIGLLSQVNSSLYRRAGSGGAWTYIGNQARGRWTVCTSPSHATGLVDPPGGALGWECFLNLTAGWQLKQRVRFEQYISEVDNTLTTVDANLSIQYCGVASGPDSI